MRRRTKKQPDQSQSPLASQQNADKLSNHDSSEKKQQQSSLASPKSGSKSKLTPSRVNSGVVKNAPMIKRLQQFSEKKAKNRSFIIRKEYR